MANKKSKRMRISQRGKAGIDPGQPDDDAVDEVPGEPVSRREARHLGFVGAASPKEMLQPISDSEANTRLIQDRRERHIPPEVLKHIHLAGNHLDKGEPGKALEIAQLVLERYPTLPEIRLIMIRAFMELGNFAGAMSLLQSLPKSEVTGEILYYRGVAHAKLGQAAEAIRHLESARKDPELHPTQRDHAATLLVRLLQGPVTSLTDIPSVLAWDRGRMHPRPISKRIRRRRQGKILSWFFLILFGLLVLLVLALRYWPEICGPIPGYMDALWPRVERMLEGKIVIE